MSDVATEAGPSPDAVAVADQRDPPWGRTRWGRPRWGPVSRRRRWRQSQMLRLVAVALVAVATWLVATWQAWRPMLPPSFRHMPQAIRADRRVGAGEAPLLNA